MGDVHQIPTLPLRDGGRIPQLGFGVFKVPPQDTARVVSVALEAGYRHIDTAAAYHNESGVGAAVRASGLPRHELFVTTKVWNSDHGRARATEALARSLDRLGMDHVDLYLIHWPLPMADRYLETWKALVELRDAGFATAIGVSNFTERHLRRLVEEAAVVPAVNQVECHPRLHQESLRALHDRLGIVTAAWSPLAKARVLDEPAIARIAATHARTPAQVVLRWHLQLGNVAIPKSVTPARISTNLDVLDFALSEEDMLALAALDRDERTGPHPDVFDLGAFDG